MGALTAATRDRAAPHTAAPPAATVRVRSGVADGLGRELVESILLVVFCFATSALLVGVLLGVAWLLS